MFGTSITSSITFRTLLGTLTKPFKVNFTFLRVSSMHVDTLKRVIHGIAANDIQESSLINVNRSPTHDHALLTV
jgi:hypothetical protein